jgi:non-canonical (house-cleaning) NTP pyrophosphatase
MRIILGSNSSPKLDILKKFFKDKKVFSVLKINVNSGISDQPLNRKETISGSINRAVAASKKSSDFDIAVGLEGGLYKYRGLYNLICAAAILDKKGKIFIGTGGRVPLPIGVSKNIDNGKSFGEEIRVFSRNNKFDNNKNFDYINELITREKSFEEALMMAYRKYINKSQRSFIS